MLPTAEVAIQNFRQALAHLEDEMKKQPQAKVKIKHIHGDGWVARQMSAPAGAIIMGARHKFDNTSLLSKGKIIIIGEDGANEFTAPATVIAKAGTKRLGFVQQDVVWTSIVYTDERDPKKIMQLFIESDDVAKLEG